MPTKSVGESLQQARYTIDPITLREVVTNKAVVEARIVELEDLGESGDAERISWLRILGRLQEAEDLSWYMLVKSGGASDTRQITDPLPYNAVTAALRLAHVLHWQQRYSHAIQLFSAALGTAESAVSDPDKSQSIALTLVAFARQHLGKMYFDQGRFEEALESFQSALNLRQEMKSPEDQIESTLQAISTTKACIAKNGATS
ncbi:tetratricopeptide repeat protein [Paeniglutamicibacter sp. ORCA_105]|uniref:tetratricopeptide repeat protein n=1 Tax=Paeniglutamicibacter sp. ORCA_105 TaxID=3377336 RepID=UPI0038952291